MKCSAIFEKIDEMYDEYLRVWEEVCNIESPTNLKTGVDAVGEYFITIAEKHGWDVEIMSHEKAGNAICITMNKDAKKAPFCISGHIDTVHPVGMFGYPCVRYDEEKIYGPGVADCKGGIVAGLLAMHALEIEGFDSRPIRLILQTDEEGSSKMSEKATVAYMCDKAKGAVGFINLEPSDTTELCILRKGIITYNFTVTGVEAHASACATKGSNAIADAAHKIIELEKFKDANGITCNCGVISGGTVPNTVAGKCEFVANFRFATKEQRDYIEKLVAELVDTVHVEGCCCEAVISSFRPAMEKTETNMQFFDTMCKIFEETGLEPIVAGSRTGGSDAAYITEMGIPCVDSLGVTGGAIHSIGEFALLSSLTERAKRIAAIIYCI